MVSVEKFYPDTKKNGIRVVSAQKLLADTILIPFWFWYQGGIRVVSGWYPGDIPRGAHGIVVWGILLGYHP